VSLYAGRHPALSAPGYCLYRWDGNMYMMRLYVQAYVRCPHTISIRLHILIDIKQLTFNRFNPIVSCEVDLVPTTLANIILK